MTKPFIGVALLRYSLDCVNLVKEFEGCELASYDDGVGNWTIGWGHTRGIRKHESITFGEAEAYLRDDLTNASAGVHAYIDVPLTQGMFDALVSFVFNLGAYNLQHSTMRKLINAKEYSDAADEFPKWDMAGHKHWAGLKRRRLAERQLFLS